jgi:hypothetical protein
VLARGVLALVLALVVVLLALHLGAVGVSTFEVALLMSTSPPVRAVVMEPLELVDDQHQLVIFKYLNLLLSDRHQRRQGKQSG